ncbi:MAG TPA: lipid A deacylase LpxR family protein [Acetobacteraceae bacterium]|nr:lipid A deacylase LpxR family protein [Acetobacteraceae bacterium]
MRNRMLALVLVAVPAAGGVARAEPRQDPNSIWTFQVENDAASTLKGTSDQYYTSGLRIGWTSPTDALPTPLADAGHFLWGDGVQRVSIDLRQSIFTPRDTQLEIPNPHDRPYAGELVLTGGLIQDTDTTRDLLDLTVGTVGPSSLARQVQNGFHSIIGDTQNKGWHYQIQDQPAIEVLEQRTWRLPIAQAYGLETDTLPSAAIGLGDLRDYIQVGAIFRIGQGLNSDFGTSRIEPGLNGSDAYVATRPFAWYVFGGVDGQAVGYDVTLDGSTFRRNTPSVHRVWDVGEIEAGIAVMLYGCRISYTQTWQTQEFDGQKGGLFNFGSLTLSTKF